MTDEKHIAWVTGAGTGIGKAIALGLLQKGYRVVISGRRSEPLETLRNEAGEFTSFVHPIVCDVTSEKEVFAAAERIAQEIGPLDVLVNNAGTTVFKSFLKTSVEEFDTLCNANLRGAFLCTKAVLPQMVEREQGTIVMINSQSAKIVFYASSVYAATKAGLQALTDGLRLEVRKKGVRVLSVFPGATETDIWPVHVLEEKGKDMMRPEQVAEPVIHAISMPHSVMIEDLYLQPIGGSL